MKTYIKTVGLSLVIAIIILNIFSFYLVSGNSMVPTLENRDYLIVKKPFINDLIYNRYDIVVFHKSIQETLSGEKDLVKRIIGLPGDHVVINHKGVFINDKKLNESYLLEDNTQGKLDLIVKKGTYFVMGDNREVSLDSRLEGVGLISEEEILGKVIVKMFPYERIGDENYEN